MIKKLKKMIRICKYCGIEYENGFGTFCSRSCCAKEIQNRSEIKEQTSKCSKERNNKPDVKEKFYKVLKDRWNKNGAKEKQSEIMKEFMNRPDIKEAKSNFQKEFQNRPAVIEANKQRGIEMWKDSTFAEKQFKNHTAYKEYLMPSGKVVKIQGYEPQVLTELLETYSEDDIIIGVKEMNKEIGQIRYMFEGKERTYYPDFYIKSENKIIEVKSKWTYEMNKEKTLAKEHACLLQGFDFSLIIWCQESTQECP